MMKSRRISTALRVILESRYPVGHGHSLPPDIMERKLFLLGDCLSMDNIRYQHSRVLKMLTHPGQSEFVKNILTAMRQVREGPGDLHIGMHMLVLIHLYFYPGLLQVCQANLQWKRIQLNPLKNYQASRWLCFSTASRLLSFQDFILVLAHNYQQYFNTLSKSNDEVVQFVSQFMSLAEDFHLFLQGIQSGDAICIEKLFLEWLPLWKSGGKFKYTELVQTITEVLYKDLKPHELFYSAKVLVPEGKSLTDDFRGTWHCKRWQN